MRLELVRVKGEKNKNTKVEALQGGKGGNWVVDEGWKVGIKTIEGVKKRREIHAYSFESWKLTLF